MKNDKNNKNKISLKTTLYNNNLKSLKPQRINIQTLIKPKINSYQFIQQNRTKKYIESNEIDNDYSFFSNDNSISNKNKKINISNSSNNSMYTYKKRKYKRDKRIKNRKKYKKSHKISNSLESINDLSINSINNNNNLNKINNYYQYSSSFSISHSSKNKYSNYSSSSKYSSSNNDYSDSSETSNNSIQEYKKNNYFSKMLSKNNKLDNLTKKEVGIISSDDEDNNINQEENNDKDQNNNTVFNNINQQNYSEEIERILIDIYNKNISIINSQNLGSPITKKLFETNSIDKKKLKNFFKKQHTEENLLALKTLSEKIKCLIEKCKEKIYEIDDIKKLYEQYIRDNTQRYCNSIGSSGLTTNSNSSSYYGSGSDDENYYIRNSLLINNIQDETFCKDISQDLLTQLINIKNTLKASSKEIENVFKYAFNSLKTNDGKKVKINIELMQLQQYNKVILNDDLISTLLIQIKFVFSKYKEDYIVQIIDQLQQESILHKNSMTKFDNLLIQNLEIINSENENKLLNDNLNKEEKENYNKIIEDNNEFNNDNNSKQDINNKLINLENSSLNEEDNDEENNINNEENILNENKNNNNQETQLYEESNTHNTHINNNKENNNNEYNDEKINFESIDDLVRFINEDNTGDNQKNANKKNKKRNKRKKKKKNVLIEKEENNNLDMNNNINDLPMNEYINKDDDDFIKSFKEDIIKNTIYNYEIKKSKPKIPENYSFDKFLN